MIRILLFTFLIAALIGALFVFSGDMGYLQVRIAGWTIETTLGIALLGIILTLGLVGLLLKIIMLPVRLGKQWSNERTRQQSIKYSEGLTAFANEEFDLAMKHFRQIKSGPLHLSALLIGILVAQKLKDRKKRDEIVRETLQKYPKSIGQIHLIESICLQENGEIEPALQLLQSHIESGRYNVSHWRRLVKILMVGGRWAALGKILEQSKVKLPNNELEELQAYVISQQFLDCKSIQDFTTTWDSLARKMRLHPVVIDGFCDAGLRLGWKGNYVDPILAGLKKRWSVTLLHCLERVPIQSTLEILKWLDKQENTQKSAELYMTRSVIAAREEMWGIAEESIQRAETYGGSSDDILFTSMLLAVLQKNPARVKALLFEHLKGKYPQLTKT